MKKKYKDEGMELPERFERNILIYISKRRSCWISTIYKKIVGRFCEWIIQAEVVLCCGDKEDNDYENTNF